MAKVRFDRDGNQTRQSKRERARAENQLEAGGRLVLLRGTPLIAIWRDYSETTADGRLPQLLR